MTTLNDAILLATGGPTINEGLATHFSRTVAESLQDAERRYLIEKGATPGHRNDMWFGVLRANGHTGTLNDMLFTFWDGGGILP